MTYIPSALRDEVISRANSRCEYCRIPESYTYHTHEIDHIYAEKHGGQTTSENLSLACADCNRRKGSDLCSIDSTTGALVALFHPRNEIWDEHFIILETGVIHGISSHGRVTARLLGFNRPELVFDRVRQIKLGVYSVD